jgi:putative chitobiose transport system substrate-binding protein
MQQFLTQSWVQSWVRPLVQHLSRLRLPQFMGLQPLRRLQRRLAWVVLGLVLTGLVASCTGPKSGTGSGAGANSGEVEFWTMQLQPEYTAYFTQLISAFEKDNAGLKVKWVDVPWSAMQSKILTAVSSGQVPDVVNLNPDFASQLASRNAWLPLDDKVPAEVRQQYLPKIWQASTLNSQSFGLPWYLTTRVAIYNQDLLKQAGITKPPATFDELAQAAKLIKDKTGKYAFFVTFVPEDSGEVMEALVQMGVTLVNDQGKAAFNSPEGKKAFQYWVDLYKAKLLPQEVLTQGHRRAIELYQAGETAMLASGAEFLKQIATNAPAIAKASTASAQISGSTGKKNVAVMNLVIPKTSDNPDGALKFALFVTNPQNQLTFAKAANVLPSTTASLTTYQADLTKLGAQASSVEQARAVSAKQLDEAQVLLPVMKDSKKLQKIVYDNLQAAMLGDKTVEAALKDAAEEWDSNT